MDWKRGILRNDHAEISWMESSILVLQGKWMRMRNHQLELSLAVILGHFLACGASCLEEMRWLMQPKQGIRLQNGRNMVMFRSKVCGSQLNIVEWLMFTQFPPVRYIPPNLSGPFFLLSQLCSLMGLWWIYLLLNLLLDGWNWADWPLWGTTL